MWATANLQQTWEPRGQEISLQRKRQELTDLESDTTLWPPHYFSLDPARPYSHLPLCSPNRTQKNHSKNSMENDQVPLEPASIYCNHISSTCSTLITAWHESTVFLFGTYAHPYFESWTCRHLWLPPFCPMEARPNRLSRHPGKRQGRHAIILQ